MELTSPVADMDLGRAIDLIIEDPTLPPHLKAALGSLLEMKDQLGLVISKNKELLEENSNIRKRNTFNKYTVLEKQQWNQQANEQNKRRGRESVLHKRPISREDNTSAYNRGLLIVVALAVTRHSRSAPRKHQ
ncbi:hypothetical protein COOONC_16088 [Cooperia oncophora]